MGEIGNRPDCAYFLLLGLCGAAFLLTIGGILTYIAFNPGSIDTHPHSALSHIPHFHHHKHHPGSSINAASINNNHHHYQHQQNTAHHQQSQQDHRNPNSADSHQHPDHQQQQHHEKQHEHELNPSESSQQRNKTVVESSDHKEKNEKPLEETSRKKNSSDDSPGGHYSTLAPTLTPNTNTTTAASLGQKHPDSESPASSIESFEAKAKQSLALAIIGPLCLLMGIVILLIVGVLALRFDCDHEPEPNIAFLRLRSEMSLNFDADKNNYELLRPSSSIDQAGGQYSINPTGLPRC